MRAQLCLDPFISGWCDKQLNPPQAFTKWINQTHQATQELAYLIWAGDFSSPVQCHIVRSQTLARQVIERMIEKYGPLQVRKMLYPADLVPAEFAERAMECRLEL